MENTYDLIVIGAGPGGYSAAVRGAQLGLRTAIVERENLGGICLNWGCIPTKALLKSAEVYTYLNHAADYALAGVSVPAPDLPAIVQRSRDIAAQMSRGVEFLMKKNKIDVFSATARVLPGHRVEIVPTDGGAPRELSAPHILIATGARSRQLPGLPQDGECIIGYRQALTLQQLPETMLVVGSGAIGSELAYFYNALGTKVTVVEYLPRILPLEDAEVSREAERIFRKRGIKLVDLKATDLQDFYTKQLERVKANSVIHYHANIHKALKYAVKIDLIPTNPADKVERPKKNEFKGSYYSADEIHALTEIAEGTKLEIPVLLASFYGLRRSEVLGLKWDAIDFEANTLEIKHIVTQASIDGKKVLVQADRAKTKSSLRTLPLVPPIRDRLLMLKGQQDTYRRLCGKSYNRDYLGYLCVDEIGNIIRPNYVSEQFPKLLEKNGLRPIRFHDLRHSCASLLLANGVPMKQIQEWLGHSDFSTTANIYAHLDYASKLSSAQAMLEGLGYGNASA